MTMQARHESLRIFALDIYGREGIAPLCLQWQDRYGVDVTVLLMAAWSGARRHLLSRQDIAEASTFVGSWRREVVEPLRRIRRWLKEPAPPFATQETEKIRETVKAAELRSELLALRILAEVCAPDVSGVEATAAMRENISAVFSHFAPGIAIPVEDIERFVSAAALIPEVRRT